MLVTESRMVMGKAHVFHVGSLRNQDIFILLELLKPRDFFLILLRNLNWGFLLL